MSSFHPHSLTFIDIVLLMGNTHQLQVEAIEPKPEGKHIGKGKTRQLLAELCAEGSARVLLLCDVVGTGIIAVQMTLMALLPVVIVEINSAALRYRLSY